MSAFDPSFTASVTHFQRVIVMCIGITWKVFSIMEEPVETQIG